MSAKPERRICWNCEGNVQFSQDVCPYCQTSLDQASLDQIGHDTQPENLLRYAPPYRLSDHISNGAVLPSPFGPMEAQEPIENESEEEENDAITDEAKSMAITMALLMTGSILLLFSIALWLFSSNGYLVLQWNGRYWFLYLLTGVSMFYFGWRNLAYLSDENRESP